jgi:peptidoglycan-associated lipoprotein
MKNLIIAIAAVVFAIGCQSKKVVDDTKTVPTEAVASTPVADDPAGSDGGKIAGLVTVHFEYDRATLSADAKKELAGNAEWIKSNAKKTIQIEGHCDNRGTIEYNLALGERRAQSVKSYLVGLGVPAGRLNVISYGEEKPVLSGDSEEAWGKNRRANFVPMATN